LTYENCFYISLGFTQTVASSV